MYLYILINLQIVLCTAQFLNDEDTNLKFYSPLDTPVFKYLTTINNNCICRESSQLGTVCSGEKCTNFPADLIVSLPFFKLQFSSVAVLRKYDFHHLSNLTGLEIEGNLKLSKIEEGIFRNMSHLKNLTITSNGKLNFIEQQLFEGLVALEILNISNNGFFRISDITKACSPKYLPKIKLLTLSEYMFHELRFDDFYPMNGSRLEQLNLIVCGIITIHPDVLKPFKNLTDLRLSQNLINQTTLTKFIERTFALGIQLDKLDISKIGLQRTSPYPLLDALGKSNLTYLILAENDLNIIDDKWFPFMPKLLTLDLCFCAIFEISDNAFRPLPHLQRLLLKGNKLTTIPSAVTILKGLYILDIGTNSYEEKSSYFYMPPNIFKNNMTNMTYLQISYNNIGSISKSTFSGLTTIIKLTMKNAYISHIEIGSFAHMKKLFYLELTNNPLLGPLSLTADTFLGLGNLRVLLLGACCLQNLTLVPSIFTHVSNLTHLSLDRNNFRIILPNQLTHLNLLSELQLSDNKLPSWNSRILPSSNLSLLNLSQNKFINITVAMLEDWSSVPFLYLQDNPFWCDCTLYAAAKWIKNNQRATMHKTAKQLLGDCIVPEKWRDKSVFDYITYLNLDTTGDCEVMVNLAAVIIGSVLLAVVVMLVLLGYWYRWHVRYWLFLWRLSFAKHTRSTGPSSDLAYEYDAFVSYSVEDRAWVAMMVEALEPTLRLCVFERDFPAGAAISQAALRAVVASRRTLLVLSEAFARSRWCRWEAQLAQFHQLFFRADSAQGPDDTLLLVRLQPVRRHVTPTLRYLMKTRIYLDWPQDSNRQQEFWERLKTTISTPKGKAL